MNYNEELIKYINNCRCDEPIFREEIKDYFKTYNVYLCGVSFFAHK